jgi:hypothetical protein
MSRNASPFRYAPWLARDVARGPGLLYLVLSVALAVIFWRIKQRTGSVPDVDEIQAMTMARVLTIACLIAVGGMVSTDVQQGFYRAWFTKPMAPWWYYLQRWILGGLAVLLIPVVYGLLLALLIGGGLGITTDLMIGVALGYLLIGAAVFLASTLTRWDWLFVFLISAAQTGLAGLVRMGVELPTVVNAVYRVLPPFHLLDPSADALTGRPLIHVLAYGIGMLALALLLLVQRPLGSGGRA